MCFLAYYNSRFRLVCKCGWCRWTFFSFLTVLILVPSLGVVSYPIIALTEGLLPEYSTGVREGYLTKVSIKGIIYKTNEAQIQVGTGEMAALQEPWAFSIPDQELNEKAGKLLGKRVRIHYNQWLIAPYWLGETNNILTKIEPIVQIER